MEAAAFATEISYEMLFRNLSSDLRLFSERGDSVRLSVTGLTADSLCTCEGARTVEVLLDY